MARIGSYELHTIETGRFGLDGGGMFGVVPRALWERHIQPDDKNRIPLAMRCLLLEGEGRVILIDNGIGAKGNEKFASIYAIDYAHTELHRSLEQAGFCAADVTDVVYTHLHFDHCGGGTAIGRHGPAPVFENALYHVQRAHWEWARHPNVREAASFMRENMEPLERAGQLHLVDGPGTLFPGVEAIIVNGHTEAQQLVKISDEERTLVFVADLLPTTVHLKGAWTTSYDVRPLVTLEEKARFLEDAVEGGWHFFFEHDPVTIVGTPVRMPRSIAVAEERSLDDL